MEGTMEQDQQTQTMEHGQAVTEGAMETHSRAGQKHRSAAEQEQLRQQVVELAAVDPDTGKPKHTAREIAQQLGIALGQVSRYRNMKPVHTDVLAVRDFVAKGRKAQAAADRAVRKAKPATVRKAKPAQAAKPKPAPKAAAQKAKPAAQAGWAKLDRRRKLPEKQGTIAKRYKVPSDVVEVIEAHGGLYGSVGRAIQVATELLVRMKRKPQLDGGADRAEHMGQTFKLVPRTVDLIEGLAEHYGTRGHALAACALVLQQGDALQL